MTIELKLTDIQNKFPCQELEIEIEDIAENKWNPNVQSELMFQKQVESIREFGFLQPLLVRRLTEENEPAYYEVIDGAHRLKAVKTLGWTKVKVWNFGKITDSQAKLLLLLMNKLKGSHEILKEAELLKGMESGQQRLLPMTQEEIDFNIKLLDFDFSQYENKKSEEQEKTVKDILKEAHLSFHKTYILLDDIYSKTTDTTIRLFIEDFRRLYKIYQEIV